jgi:hypothetical protein
MQRVCLLFFMLSSPIRVCICCRTRRRTKLRRMTECRECVHFFRLKSATCVYLLQDEEEDDDDEGGKTGGGASSNGSEDGERGG